MAVAVGIMGLVVVYALVAALSPMVSSLWAYLMWGVTIGATAAIGLLFAGDFPWSGQETGV